MANFEMTKIARASFLRVARTFARIQGMLSESSALR
jgi:hypothetical protein